MSKYSVEEVRAMASDLRGAPGTSMIGTHISLPTARAVAIYEALCAYAERIEADEGAADYPECSGDPSSCPENEGRGCCKPNTPAQAAQVDKPPRLGGCCCGEPCTLGVVHRTDGPCFHYVEPTAEPVAQGEAVDEIARLQGVIERDRTVFCNLIAGLKRELQCREWLGDENARAAGGYRYDEPGFIREFGDAWTAIMSALSRAHNTFRDFTDCPRGDALRTAQAEAETILSAQPVELPEFLKDPANVHVMMLRGAIAIPSIRSMVDLRGEVPNGEDAQLARITELQEQVAALEAQPAERDEMSPDFTDSARAAITWVLYHHQGGSSPIGQPLRFALGMGASERLPDWRIAEAKRWAQQTGATTDRFHQPAERMVEGKLVGYVWPGKADYDYIHRCMGKDGDPEARRIPGGAVGVYAPLTAAQDADR